MSVVCYDIIDVCMYVHAMQVINESDHIHNN